MNQLKSQKKIGKRGWLKIVEVFVAVLIIISAVLVIMSRSDPKPDSEPIIYEKQQHILDLISKNNSLRQDIISNDNTRINSLITSLVPLTWNFETKICEIDEICSYSAPAGKEVYTSEVVVTSTLRDYSPKKLKLFVWMK